MEATALKGYKQTPREVPITIMGFDPGFGNVKAVINGRPLVAPSFLSYKQLSDVDGLEGAFTYLDGPAKDLIGTSCIFGSKAPVLDPENFKAIYQDKRNKRSLGLEMLIGTLALRKPSRYIDLRLVFSTHLQQNIEPLTSRFNGIHELLIQGQRVGLRVKVIKGYLEGVGAVLSQGLHRDTALLLDIGTGTTTGTVFSAGGRIVARKPLTGGGAALLEAIANSEELVTALEEPGEADIIKAALERNSFDYAPGVSFREAYDRVAPTWVSSRIDNAMSFFKEYSKRADSYVAIGGGVLLPGVSEALAKRGFTVAQDPAFANAQGLATIAGSKAK